MQEENSTSHPFGVRLKTWSKSKFGSLRIFADRLGISPQHLSAYISGERRPTFDTMCSIRSLGADLNFLFDGNSTECVINEPEQPGGTRLALQAAFTILSLPVEAIADQVEASPKQVQSWIDKKAAPSHRQLALLFNLVAFAGVAARCGGHGAAVSQPASSDHPGQAAA